MSYKFSLILVLLAASVDAAPMGSMGWLGKLMPQGGKNLTAKQFGRLRAKLTPRVRAQRDFNRWLRANPALATFRREEQSQRTRSAAVSALVGSGLGAVTGAAFAGNTGGTGAAIGTAAGAVAGAFTGWHVGARTGVIQGQAHPDAATIFEAAHRGVPGTAHIAETMLRTGLLTQPSLVDAAALRQLSDTMEAEVQRKREANKRYNARHSPLRGLPK